MLLGRVFQDFDYAMVKEGSYISNTSWCVATRQLPGGNVPLCLLALSLVRLEGAI